MVHSITMQAPAFCRATGLQAAQEHSCRNNRLHMAADSFDPCTADYLWCRVLYVDIDIHHGDGVEEAFYLTDRVMTVRGGTWSSVVMHDDIGAVAEAVQGRAGQGVQDILERVPCVPLIFQLCALARNNTFH